MKQDLFTSTIADGLSRLELSLDSAGIGRLYTYYVELKKWSRRVNLIAKGTADKEIIENHFLDSLTLLPLLHDDDHLLDIGTGAGFPGLVLKAAMPGLHVTLVEPRRKRVTFLNHIIRTVGVGDVGVFECRAEDDTLLPADMGVTHVTSRAVTEISGFLDMTARFAQSGACVICMKGPRWQEELENAAEHIKNGGFNCCEKRIFHLPNSGAERALVLFTKENQDHSGS
ncbi:16S rRNA (guanine(527)-N(7))-methyltransferase RsmG [Desulfopila sp. IMCC35008]|uniref:16S rRNA (guanine(527)-N(7))-methyltransferase RsmG n=1 Tax=Desulfopila sp. IMCC35008 TaxID=2653858 RepID=UPI0013D3DE54|nr:16S rRNA (guanine(527)-N(7))-methyltransferase RsmG [Desulfopila sp. IMCC35008]